MAIIIIGIIVMSILAYYAYTNAMDIQYKLHIKKDYSEDEYKGDKQSGGTAIGIITAVMVGLLVLVAFYRWNIYLNRNFDSDIINIEICIGTSWMSLSMNKSYALAYISTLNPRG